MRVLALALALAATSAPGARAANCGAVAAAYRATLDQGRLPPGQGTPEWCAAARRLLPGSKRSSPPPGARPVARLP